MQRETRVFVLDNFAIEQRGENGTDPVIVGHAAVFNQLSPNLGGFREKIAPGAFAEAITQDDVRALFNHDANYILGRNKAGTLSLKEDATGLAVEIMPPDTTFARDLMVSMKRGDITQMSFAFGVKPDGQDWGEDADGTIIRTLKNLRLYDVSPVVYPAYPQTDVAVRAFEEWQAEHAAPVAPVSLWQLEAVKRAVLIAGL